MYSTITVWYQPAVMDRNSKWSFVQRITGLETKKKPRGFEDEWNMIYIISNVFSKILNTGMLGHPIENYVKGSETLLM